MEPAIAEWRSFVDGSDPGNGRDVEALDAHLRDQISGLRAAGLSDDEAFLVAVTRLARLDRRSQSFARRDRDRLWQPLLTDGDGSATPSEDRTPTAAIAFAVAAAVIVQLARLAAGFPSNQPTWLFRNAGLFVLPVLAGWFVHRRGPRRPTVIAVATAFGVAAVAVNAYPWAAGSGTELLAVTHLPVALWFVVGHAHTGGTWRSHERRMDFVRFTGEWAIVYALLALGGGVLLGLTAAVLGPAGVDPERIVEWVLPSGAAGAVIVAAWLAETRQEVSEHLAPVLTMVFTPMFALMTTVTAVVYAVTGPVAAFDRDLLGVFDALLVAVLALVLYGVSARRPSPAPGWTDRMQLIAVTAALALDGMVLAAMAARIGDLGVTPNRVAALGLNLVLLVGLAVSGWLTARFVAGRGTLASVERWQTSYLPVFALWATAVVLVLPPLFRFR